MPFQFHCPQGHLLEADESQVGQQSQCPMCGETFAIPSPTGEAPAEPASQFGPFGPGAAASPQEAPFPFSPGGGPVGDPLAELSGPKLLHIPCPSGHELEVPPEMIGQDVMCPHCRVQFRLRESDSVEHRRRRQEELELRDHKSGQTWIMWAIIFAVLVLIGLITLMAISAGV